MIIDIRAWRCVGVSVLFDIKIVRNIIKIGIKQNIRGVLKANYIIEIKFLKELGKLYKVSQDIAYGIFRGVVVY